MAQAKGRPRRSGTAPSAADARRRRVEAEVKRILAERDPGEVLEAMRLHLDEAPRDQIAFQRDVLEVAGARYEELRRGRKG
jgi:hypothetical protein